MLEEQDLQQIGNIVEQKVKTEFQEAEKRIVNGVVEQVGEMIEQNVLPQFKSLVSQVQSIKVFGPLLRGQG